MATFNVSEEDHWYQLKICELLRLSLTAYARAFGLDAKLRILTFDKPDGVQLSAAIGSYAFTATAQPGIDAFRCEVMGTGGSSMETCESACQLFFTRYPQQAVTEALCKRFSFVLASHGTIQVAVPGVPGALAVDCDFAMDWPRRLGYRLCITAVSSITPEPAYTAVYFNREAFDDVLGAFFKTLQDAQTRYQKGAEAFQRWLSFNVAAAEDPECVRAL